jgi:hypothetical protein
MGTARALGIIIPLLVLVVVGAGGWFVYSALNPPPKPQPVAFPHTVHVQALQLDCQFCHRGAATQAAATVPAVEQCMFCHKVAGHNRPEVQKVLAAWQNREPINWLRVYRVPDHVHFVHEAHINAGFDCSVCHGQVGQMQVVQHARDLRMGDCITCHQQNNAPTDCTTCHY